MDLTVKAVDNNKDPLLIVKKQNSSIDVKGLQNPCHLPNFAKHFPYSNDVGRFYSSSKTCSDQTHQESCKLTKIIPKAQLYLPPWMTNFINQLVDSSAPRTDVCNFDYENSKPKS